MKNTSDRCVYSPEKKYMVFFFQELILQPLTCIIYQGEIYALTELIWNKYKIEGFLRFDSCG